MLTKEIEKENKRMKEFIQWVLDQWDLNTREVQERALEAIGAPIPQKGYKFACPFCEGLNALVNTDVPLDEDWIRCECPDCGMEWEVLREKD